MSIDRILSLLCFLCICQQVVADVVINEIYYHAPDDLDELEYVEIFNASSGSVDVSGWKVTGEIRYEFPRDSILDPGQFWVIAKDADILFEFFQVRAHGKFSKSLSNGGGEIRLVDDTGELVEMVEYDDRAPWPVAADGYSASLERISTSADTSARNWAPSELSRNYDTTPAGTPGKRNSTSTERLPPQIGEITWHPTQPVPNTDIQVTITPPSTSNVTRCAVSFERIAPGKVGDKVLVLCHRRDGAFVATIPAGTEPNRLLRFRVHADGRSGGKAVVPHPNAIRPAFSIYVKDGKSRSRIGAQRGFGVSDCRIPNIHLFEIGDPLEAQYHSRSQNYRGHPFGRRRSRYDGFPPAPLRPQGNWAVLFTPPGESETQVFDFVNFVQRKSGWKVRLHKDRPLMQMSTVNLLYERNEQTILNESLAYQLYGLAGNDTCRSGYMRLVVNGSPIGYHLYFEQPNNSFFRRHDVNTKGDLYKLIWMGNARMSPRVPVSQRRRRPDITGRYEKKSNRHEGHQGLIEVIEAFENAESDAEVWSVIEEHVEVEQVANYFAVNSLLSHWDGFFNNYFAYFDRKGTGKWSLFPWDQDSTWSQRGGRPRDLYAMPLFFGATGATPSGMVKPSARSSNSRPGTRGFGYRSFGSQGYSWWRPAGDFSGPLLANPTFYAKFQQRLRELAESVFTEGTFQPRIDRLQSDLEPEVRLRARLQGGNEDRAVATLRHQCNALSQHLRQRRAFVLRNIQ